MCFVAHRRHRGAALYSLAPSHPTFGGMHRYSSVRSGASSDTTTTTAASDFLDESSEQHKRFIRRFQNKQKMFAGSKNWCPDRRPEKGMEVKRGWKATTPEGVLLQLPKK